MTTINSFVNRLSKIGVDVHLVSNYPWVYLDGVNGKKIKEKFKANHGYCIGYYPKFDQSERRTIFNKIRDILKAETKQQKGNSG